MQMADYQQFDLIVIGGGPGGYVAAIRAAQQGAKVALVEAKLMGGSCLNFGCIPTKTLLAGAAVVSKIKRADQYGISVGAMSIDFSKMTDRKDGVVTGIRTSLEGLIKTDGITIVRGWAKLNGPNEVKVLGDEPTLLRADKIILATGSEPKNVGAFPFDPPLVHSSTSILELRELPKSLAVVGGGVIGCEAACLYAELGVKVTIIEMLPTILSTEPADNAKAIHKALEAQGIEILTEVMVEGIDKGNGGVKIRLKDREAVSADMALVAIGRTMNTDNLGLDKVGIAVDRMGYIEVNDQMETTAPGIYAIGDITGKYLLAHVASHQGIVAADNAVGKRASMHYNAIPSIVYTHPESGNVGLTLEKAKLAGYDAAVGRFPFSVLGRNLAEIETEGFAQVVIDKKTGVILGAQAVAHEVGTLITEMTTAIANELTVECIEETVHAHPTASEAWLEATLMAAGRPLHLPFPKKKK
jgi:dihydrolipoyl dehydrogenase